MKNLYLLGIPLAVAACADSPELTPPDRLAPAANPHVQIRHVHGPAVLSGYAVRPVKGPEDWRKLNDRQSPATQGDS